MNLIPKLAEAIGVELGEEFKVITPANIEKRCRFYERGDGRVYLEKFNVAFNQWTQENTDEIGRIVTGNYDVMKIPFAPKEEEEYWTVGWSSAQNIYTTKQHWANDEEDYMCKYCDNVFRTCAEAEAKKIAVYERLTGKPQEDRP